MLYSYVVLVDPQNLICEMLDEKQPQKFSLSQLCSGIYYIVTMVNS